MAPCQDDVMAPCQDDVMAPCQDDVMAPCQDDVMAPCQDDVMAPSLLFFCTRSGNRLAGDCLGVILKDFYLSEEIYDLCSMSLEHLSVV